MFLTTATSSRPALAASKPRYHYLDFTSTICRFVKIWKVNCPGEARQTNVTELQILRDHTDYLSVMRVEGDSIVSASGDGKIFLHKFPEGQQHYDMLTTCQERNSVAVLYQVITCLRATIQNRLIQGPNAGLADTVEQPTVLCDGRFCKAGKTGLAKSSSSFEVC